jgi:acyl-CoA thioester hydrolase
MAIHRHAHRVSYAECTVGDHVYYARYLDILEAARGAFFRDLGRGFRQWQADGVIFPVIEVSLRYRAPARYDDVLEIATRVTAAEGVRLDFDYRIADASGRLLVEATTRHVCAGVDERPRRLPPELVSRLREFGVGPA